MLKSSGLQKQLRLLAWLYECLKQLILNISFIVQMSPQLKCADTKVFISYSNVKFVGFFFFCGKSGEELLGFVFFFLGFIFLVTKTDSCFGNVMWQLI